MVSDEKENTDWKVYLTILALLGGAVIVLVVRFFVTDFFNESDMVKLKKIMNQQNCYLCFNFYIHRIAQRLRL